jgi:hypothetical protein
MSAHEKQYPVVLATHNGVIVGHTVCSVKSEAERVLARPGLDPWYADRAIQPMTLSELAHALS